MRLDIQVIRFPFNSSHGSSHAALGYPGLQARQLQLLLGKCVLNVFSFCCFTHMPFDVMSQTIIHFIEFFNFFQHVVSTICEWHLLFFCPRKVEIGYWLCCFKGPVGILSTTGMLVELWIVMATRSSLRLFLPTSLRQMPVRSMHELFVVIASCVLNISWLEMRLTDVVSPTHGA